jgi:hypothetical protein
VCLNQLLFRPLSEDAYVTARYALNLANGDGPVFNIGERVEGYSNFLWMVIIAVPNWIAGVDPMRGARLLGGLCAIGTVIAAYALAVKVAARREAGVIAAVLTAAIGSFEAWGSAGLETPLFALLIIGCLLAVADGRHAVAGALLGFAVMTRPDGVLVFMVVAGWLATIASPVRQRGRSVLLLVVGTGAVLIPWTIWRIAYYGHLIPNAIAAKRGMSFDHALDSGLRYFNGFALSLVPTLVIAALAISLMVVMRPARDVLEFVALIGVLIVAIVAFVIFVGGDWMPAWRFLAPIVPLFAMLIGIAWPAAGMLPSSSRTVGVVIGVTAALLLGVSFSTSELIPNVRTHRVQVEQLARVGNWLDAALPPGTVIATLPNGALSYHAGPGIQVIDALGLTDEHIARDGHRNPEGFSGHVAYDYAYVVRQRPELVYPGISGLDEVQSCVVYRHFEKDYVPLTFRERGSFAWANLMVRRDEKRRLERLLDGSDFEHIACSRGVSTPTPAPPLFPEP